MNAPLLALIQSFFKHTREADAIFSVHFTVLLVFFTALAVGDDERAQTLQSIELTFNRHQLPGPKTI